MPKLPSQLKAERDERLQSFDEFCDLRHWRESNRKAGNFCRSWNGYLITVFRASDGQHAVCISDGDGCTQFLDGRWPELEEAIEAAFYELDI